MLVPSGGFYNQHKAARISQENEKKNFCFIVETLTQGPPEQVEGVFLLLVQVDIVPQELDVHLLTVL